MSNLQLDKHTYASLCALLDGRDEVKMCYKTWAIRLDATTVAIRYHHTNIITYTDDGHVYLNNGGWYTRTTLFRMARATGLPVRQKDWTWYVGDEEYYNGMCVALPESADEPKPTLIHIQVM